MSAQPPQSPKKSVDRDGVARIATGPSARARRGGSFDESGGGGAPMWPWVLAGLFALVCLGGALWLVFAARAPSRVRAERPEAKSLNDDNAPERPRGWDTRAPAPRAEEPHKKAPVDEDAPDEDPVPPELLVHPGEVPEVTGGKTGIAAFPPRGTKPLKRGIVVPENYPLPPGYVRHYQSSDDGEQLLPILMFHPDHKPVDAQGRPIAIPDDRVVTPELAPPEMPIQMLDLPDGDGAPK